MFRCARRLHPKLHKMTDIHILAAKSELFARSHKFNLKYDYEFKIEMNPITHQKFTQLNIVNYIITQINWNEGFITTCQTCSIVSTEEGPREICLSALAQKTRTQRSLRRAPQILSSSFKTNFHKSPFFPRFNFQTSRDLKSETDKLKKHLQKLSFLKIKIVRCNSHIDF